MMSLCLLVHLLSESTELHILIFQAVMLGSICKTLLCQIFFQSSVFSAVLNTQCSLRTVKFLIYSRVSAVSFFRTFVLFNIKFSQPQGGIWVVMKAKVPSIQDLKAYGEVEVYLNSLLTSALNGCGLLAWSSGCFIPRKMLICMQEEALWTPKLLCKFRSKKKYLATAGNWSTISLSASP
jgi:hypothetical protein